MRSKKDIISKSEKSQEAEQISRKDALKKAGKYAAFTAGAMMFFFSPKKAQAESLPENPGGRW